MRSSRGHFVKASGLRWFSLMLLAPVPWAGRAWALPFLTALAPSERHARARGARHKKLTDRARQALSQLARWLPGRRVVAVADRSYTALELLHAVRGRVCVCVVARLRPDARLFDPPCAAHRRTAWYRKEEPTFSDALAAVRRSLWADAARFPTSPRASDCAEVPRAVLDRLTDITCHAACGPKSR